MRDKYGRYNINVVIKINEDYFNHLKSIKFGDYEFQIYKAVQNGIPLPKGHGNMIDVKEFIESINDWSDRMNSYEANEEVEIVKSLLQSHARTIIEADKDQEDEKS